MIEISQALHYNKIIKAINGYRIFDITYQLTLNKEWQLNGMLRWFVGGSLYQDYYYDREGTQ